MRCRMRNSLTSSLEQEVKMPKIVPLDEFMKGWTFTLGPEGDWLAWEPEDAATVPEETVQEEGSVSGPQEPER
jgi:hypothetical protein